MKVKQLRQKLKSKMSDNMVVVSGNKKFNGYYNVSRVEINENGYLELFNGEEFLTAKELLEKIEKVRDDFIVRIGVFGFDTFAEGEKVAIETLHDEATDKLSKYFVIYILV